MVVAATAPASAVLFLFVVSFLCFMSGAALRRWPDKVQAYMERVDGSLWFVSAADASRLDPRHRRRIDGVVAARVDRRAPDRVARRERAWPLA